MTGDERFGLIRVKVARAFKHSNDLRSALKDFVDSVPYVVGTRLNPETRHRIYYLHSIRNAPIEVAAIAGDVFHNLRCALDHLAYQLVLANGGAPTKSTYFPIAESIENYTAVRNGAVKGMSAEAVAAIDARTPYGAGNDILWRLHRLNNIDKHRLVLAIGSVFDSVNVAPISEREFRTAWPERFAKISMPPLFLQPADRLFPLKAGDELFIDAPDTEPNADIKFAFDVALTEPGIVDSVSLLKCVEEIGQYVDDLTATFRPFLG